MALVLAGRLGAGVDALGEEFVPQPEGVLTQTVRWEALGGRRSLRFRQLRCREEVCGVSVFQRPGSWDTWAIDVELCVGFLTFIETHATFHQNQTL